MLTVGVVTPAFNAASTIGETLDSVERQSRPADHVTVVDDGSTDRTAEICRAHPISPDIVSVRNGGAAAAINRGVRSLSTDLVAVIDADDLWPVDRLESHLAFMESNSQVDILFGWASMFLCPSVREEDGRRLQFPREPAPTWVISSATIRRSAFERAGFLNESLRHGYFIDWYHRAIAEGLNQHVIPRIALHRRVRPGTLSARKSGRQSLSHLERDFLALAKQAVSRNRQRGTPGQ